MTNESSDRRFRERVKGGGTMNKAVPELRAEGFSIPWPAPHFFGRKNSAVKKTNRSFPLALSLLAPFPHLAKGSISRGLEPESTHCRREGPRNVLAESSFSLPASSPIWRLSFYHHRHRKSLPSPSLTERKPGRCTRRQKAAAKDRAHRGYLRSRNGG